MYNRRFTLRPSHYYNAASFANCLYSHSYCAFRDVLYSIELISCIFSCKSMKIDKSCRTFNWGGRLIKPDVASSTDSQNLNIDATIAFNFFLIFLAILGYLLSWQFSIRNIYILWQNVDMIKQILSHVKVIALSVCLQNRIILIKIKCDHILKGNFFFIIKSYELFV